MQRATMLTITLLLVVATISPSLGAPPASPETDNVVIRPGNGTKIGDGRYDTIRAIYHFYQIIDQMVNTWTKLNSRYSKKGNSLRLFNPRQAKENKVLNEEVDKVLADLASQLGSNVNCPDIEDSKPHLYDFKATKCHISDFKTLKRRGNAAVESKQDSLTLRLPVSFEVLSIFYEDYKLISRVVGNQKGSIKGALHGNLFQLTLELKKTNTDCQVQLISIVLANWEKPLDVQVTDDDSGLIDTNIQIQFEDLIKPGLEELMFQFIIDALKKVNSPRLCKIAEK